jgi:transposase
MAYEEFEAILGGFEGFDLVDVARDTSVKPPRLLLQLQPKEELPKRCSRCGEVVMEIHDTVERRVRDLPVAEWETWVVFPRSRVECPRCGPTVEEVPWLDRYQRMTKRLAEKIARLAQVLPIKHVADWFGVSWDTVKELDKGTGQASVNKKTGAARPEWCASDSNRRVRRSPRTSLCDGCC